MEQKNRNHKKWMENEIPVLAALTPKQISIQGSLFCDAGTKLIIYVSINNLMLCKEDIQ